MGTKSIVKKASKVLSGGSKTKVLKKPKSSDAKQNPAANELKKKNARKVISRGSKSTTKKGSHREPYQEEEKIKVKKPKRERLTPIITDEGGALLLEKKKSSRIGGLKTRSPKNSVVPATYANPIAAYIPTQAEMDQLITDRAIRGQHDSMVNSSSDPLKTSGLAPIQFLTTYTEERGAQCQTEDELLLKAHQYFSQLNRDEQRRNNTAMKRLKEMKRVNRAGGDKDGFQYVVPKNVSTIVRQMMVAEGVEGAQVDPESLRSQLGGDGVKETEAKPMRSRRQKNQAFDDFYQFQVAKKWTKNAESFLARGRAGKNMFVAKQKQHRTIKNM